MNAAKCFWHKLLFVGILLTSIPTNCEILPTLIRSKSLLTMLIFAKQRWWLWWHCWLFWCNEGDGYGKPTWERLEERQTPPLRESLLEVWKEEGLFYDFQIFNKVQTSWREALQLLAMFRSFSKLNCFSAHFCICGRDQLQILKARLKCTLMSPTPGSPTSSDISFRRIQVKQGFGDYNFLCG